jgi:hypothetical protein
MDYILLAVLALTTVLRLVITYDIACQWSKNLDKRLEKYPTRLQPKPGTKIETAVPSWHINGHGEPCQTNFALSYMEGMGRTCGDEIEGSFSHTNSLGSSLREMGPAARHDAINDIYSGYNLNKVVRLRELVIATQVAL